jgi:pilus assembly protein CpaE
MAELSVAIVAEDNDQRAVMQVLVEGTSVARVVHVSSNYPSTTGDPMMNRIQALKPNVIFIDIPASNPGPALHAIELMHQEHPEPAIFALGPLSQPQVIVNAMRVGAKEFIQRPATTTDLLEAFVRLSSAQRKVRREGVRGKVFAVVNAKGGSGATTIAVNVALALQAAHGNTALIDLAPLGHAALHLNLKAPFTILDALRNLHRMDSSLLESFMFRHPAGLQLMAGNATPSVNEPSASEYARLFDMVGNQFRYVVVDVSSRVDSLTRLVTSLSEAVLLVAHADVASLWSASRVVQFLGEAEGHDRVKLILNRYRKMPGFDETEAESASGARLFWRVPNYFAAISGAIDRGIPVMQQSNTEVARTFSTLASTLTQNDDDVKRTSRSLFRSIQ